MPAPSEIAASALTSARIEPTDRSMPPVVMTKVIATATIMSGAIWRRMLRKFGWVRNVSVTSEKITATTIEEQRDAGDGTVLVQLVAEGIACASCRAARRRPFGRFASRPHLRTLAGRQRLERAADDEIDHFLDGGLANQPFGNTCGPS